MKGDHDEDRIFHFPTPPRAEGEEEGKKGSSLELVVEDDHEENRMFVFPPSERGKEEEEAKKKKPIVTSQAEHDENMFYDPSMMDQHAAGASGQHGATGTGNDDHDEQRMFDPSAMCAAESAPVLTEVHDEQRVYQGPEEYEEQGIASLANVHDEQRVFDPSDLLPSSNANAASAAAAAAAAEEDHDENRCFVPPEPEPEEEQEPPLVAASVVPPVGFLPNGLPNYGATPPNFVQGTMMLSNAMLFNPCPPASLPLPPWAAHQPAAAAAAHAMGGPPSARGPHPHQQQQHAHDYGRHGGTTSWEHGGGGYREWNNTHGGAGRDGPYGRRQNKHTNSTPKKSAYDREEPIASGPPRHYQHDATNGYIGATG